jgi:hypothetical protein
MIDHATIQAFADEMGKMSSIPTKLLLNPKFSKYFERVAAGGKGAPKLFKGGPPVKIKGVSPPTIPPGTTRPLTTPRGMSA